MDHNDAAYWRRLQGLRAGDKDLPSPRVCRLLRILFERWQTKPRWLTEQQVGHLVPDWDALSEEMQRKYASTRIIIRKARAVARMLELITSERIAAVADTFRIHPDELIVGTLPPFAVGQGKEFVRYLTPAETRHNALGFLNELSPMGHIVPDHGRLLERGLDGLIADCQQFALHAGPEQQIFYEAVCICLEAVKNYAEAYARQAETLAKPLPQGNPEGDNLREVAANLRQAPAGPPRTFRQAVQAVFLLHCAFHWTVEIVPLGRLDQVLAPYYAAELKARLARSGQGGRKRVTEQFRQEAQEILDCLWIKFDETVILHRRHAEDRFNSCDGTLTGFFGPSNYDQGGLLNQWMQQVTIGGVKANDRQEPEDATNDLTYLFLNCARRLPLNSPTLDLRVHRKTKRAVLEAAAAALLSGGAHPVLLNDEHIIKALDTNTNGTVPRASLRNYACDGCYETMFAGETEFSFGFVFALDVIERTLNRGAKFPRLPEDVPLHLRGVKDSWRTPAVTELRTPDAFWAVLRQHLLQACHAYLASLLTYYGNKLEVAPSPLLSAFLGGCLETGRDLNAGGARYHLFSPLLVGVSNAADSLYVIEELVFRQRVFTLDELRSCLVTDWGKLPLAVGHHVNPERMRAIQEQCRAQPKFGTGVSAVDAFGWRLLDTFVECVTESRTDEMHQQDLQRLCQHYSLPGHPFELHLVPGTGTFEQYVLLGSLSGASADGRHARDPIASDTSPAPVPADWSATDPATGRHRRTCRLSRGLQSYRHPCLDRLGDGVAVDYNLPETFPLDELVKILERFAQGQGPSVATFTVADPETFAGAVEHPEDYNLVRVRMGGWTEFFVTLFPIHQAQHQRRPLYTARSQA